MLVIDASVLVAALLDSGPAGRWAEERLLEGPLAAPHHVLVEASNVICRATLASAVADAEAAIAHDDLALVDLSLYPFAPFGRRVWELRANLTAYDAWYAALAEHLGWPLATLDRGLLQAPGPTCEIVTPTSR